MMIELYKTFTVPTFCGVSDLVELICSIALTVFSRNVAIYSVC